MMNITDDFWESIYRKQIKIMIGICYRYVGDRQVAEDLAHDAFTKAIENCDNFQGKGSFDAWLRRIVVNNALSYLRNQKREKLFKSTLVEQYAFSESLRDDESNNNLKHESFSIDELLEAINSLPEHHKLVFNLYVLDKFTHVQIATELGISSGTSKSHLARARKKLRQLLYQNAIQDKDNKRRKRALLLFAFPANMGYVDSIFKLGFEKFEINYQTSDFIKSINKDNTFNFKLKPNTFYLKIFLLIGVGIALVAVSFVYKNELYVTKSDVEKESVSQNFISKTATFSNDSVIFNNTIKNDTTMRKIKQFGFATLLTTSCLAFDTIEQNNPDKKNVAHVFHEKLIIVKKRIVTHQTDSIISKNNDQINTEVINPDVYQNKNNSFFYKDTEYSLDFCNIANESFENVSKWELDLTCCDVENYYAVNDDVKNKKVNTLIYISLKSINNKQLSKGTYVYSKENIGTRQEMTLYGNVEIDSEKLEISGGEINVDYHDEKIVLSFSFKVNNGKQISGNYIGNYKFFMSKK